MSKSNHRNITEKELREIKNSLSSIFGETIKLKADEDYYSSENIDSNHSSAGWWSNFISSFQLQIDKKIGVIIRGYLIANCHIYYEHPCGGSNGLPFYLLKHKDEKLWKLFASYQILEIYVRASSTS